MKVLIAPDSFGGTLAPHEAAAAIAEGWRRQAPADECTLAPMADGGPGFVSVLQAAIPDGRLLAVTTTDPWGRAVPGAVLMVGETAYIESAQATGAAPADRLDPERASTAGVATLITAAIDAGAREIVVGLGGSATTDGGAGLLGALGATANVPLDAGPAGLAGLHSVDLGPARDRVSGVRLIAATDVTTVLLGMFGAARTFGPQKGLEDDAILRVDRLLDGWVVAVLGSTPAERRPAEAPGAGAAGGLGFGLQLVGATTVPGIELVAERVGLTAGAATHDLVITGEGAFDHTSRAGKVVFGVAQIAAAQARPCLVLAGRVDIGAREMRAMGIEAAYAMVDLVGTERSLAQPADALADLAGRVARSWSQPARP